jgi:hypothetical protein
MRVRLSVGRITPLLIRASAWVLVRRPNAAPVGDDRAARRTLSEDRVGKMQPNEVCGDPVEITCLADLMLRSSQQMVHRLGSIYWCRR